MPHIEMLEVAYLYGYLLVSARENCDGEIAENRSLFGCVFAC